MSEKTETARFLAQVPLFRSLSRKQLQSVANAVTPRHFDAGEVMVEQGKGGVGLFILVSGRAEAIRKRLDGIETVVNTFGPTDFFGELALLNDEPRTASVVATEDTECLVLVRWELLPKLQADGEMTTAILQELASRFQRALAVL
jgi:CRP/FNR family cyclic AMP-dependent transcriptional regulator